MRCAFGVGCSNGVMKPLERVVKVILWAQLALVVVLGAVALLQAGGAGDFADLARVAAGILAVAYLIGIALAWLAARYLLKPVVARVVAAVALPALVVWGVILAIRD
jgi:hypothetical protein